MKHVKPSAVEKTPPFFHHPRGVFVFQGQSDQAKCRSPCVSHVSAGIAERRLQRSMGLWSLRRAEYAFNKNKGNTCEPKFQFSHDSGTPNVEQPAKRGTASKLALECGPSREQKCFRYSGMQPQYAKRPEQHASSGSITAPRTAVAAKRVASPSMSKDTVHAGAFWRNVSRSVCRQAAAKP